MKWRRRALLWMGTSGTQSPVEVGADDAVRTAEQLVVGAWIAELYDGFQNSDAAVQSCLRLRTTALTDLRSAQAAGDPQRIVAAQRELEAVEHDLADSRATRDSVGGLLTRELADRPSAIRVRVLPSLPAARLGAAAFPGDADAPQ